MEKCILIDGSGLIYRGFYAIPPFFKSPSGIQTNAVFGFTSIVLSLLAKYNPDYMAVAFDKKGPTFRHKEFTEYKATRVKAPDALYAQIPLVKDVMHAFGVPQFEVDGFEADDILATIAKKLEQKKDMEVLIATGDFDMFQTVGQQIHILYPTKGFKEAEIFKTEDIYKKYGVRPLQIPDYKGLAGDHSDNIPGVMGIGDKGAVSLLQKYGTLENIYKNLAEITGAVHKKLEEGKESAFMSKRLATLIDNMPMDFNIASCRVKDFHAAAAKKIFMELGFKSLLKRLDEFFQIPQAQESLF